MEQSLEGEGSIVMLRHDDGGTHSEASAWQQDGAEEEVTARPRQTTQVGGQALCATSCCGWCSAPAGAWSFGFTMTSAAGAAFGSRVSRRPTLVNLMTIEGLAGRHVLRAPRGLMSAERSARWRGAAQLPS